VVGEFRVSDPGPAGDRPTSSRPHALPSIGAAQWVESIEATQCDLRRCVAWLLAGLGPVCLQHQCRSASGGGSRILGAVLSRERFRSSVEREAHRRVLWRAPLWKCCRACDVITISEASSRPVGGLQPSPALVSPSGQERLGEGPVRRWPRPCSARLGPRGGRPRPADLAERNIPDYTATGGWSRWLDAAYCEGPSSSGGTWSHWTLV
jgi:hypothetical protein